jgi:hypothetical protein
MKATELRIGNLVQLGAHYREIKSFTRTDINPIETTIYLGLTEKLKNYPVDFNEIEPIPLTEEWLLKFGFVKDKTDNTYYKGDFEILLPVYFKWKGSIIKPKKYVHKLQNLYYELENEELSIKLK